MDPFSYEDHPIDHIEPIDSDRTREQAAAMMGLINGVLEWIGNASDREVAYWQVAYALGSIMCDESMTAKGKRLGVGHAAISKGARDFCETYGLPPSRWMKPESYAKQRREDVQSRLKEKPE